MPVLIDPPDEYRRWKGIDYRPVVRNLPVTALMAVMGKGQRVLEIGCGIGTTAIQLAASGMIVEGWDINPTAIERAKADASEAGLDHRIRWIAEDFLSCANLPASADAVVLIRVLTCIPDEPNWQRFLHRASMCVKPGGYLYVRDFLLSPETYSARYEHGRSMGWRPGTFASPEGKEPPDFLAHHHTEAELDFICRAYSVTVFNREGGLSLTGNSVRTFELLARLPDAESKS